MNILSIHNGQDTGGQSIRIKQAFDRLVPAWSFRSIVNPQTFVYLDYPADLPWSAAREAWAAADVVHLHNDFHTLKMLERGRKPAIMHYHGSAFRLDPFSRLREQRKRSIAGVVSTLDLLLISPNELEWLPSPYNLEMLRDLRP